MADQSLNVAASSPIATRGADDNGFRRGLLAALALHSLLLLGLWQAKPRVIGDPAGSDDAISVEIVSAGDMGAAGPAEAQAAEQAAAVPPPVPAPEAATEKADPAPQPAEKPSETPPEKLAATAPLPELTDMADLFALSDPKVQPKPAETATHEHRDQPSAQPKKSKPVQTSKLDLSVPDTMLSAGATASGLSASSTRPPNITRSSQNDVFGRAVIAALRATMPPPDWPPNRVTIRILLNEQGNAIDVSVIRHSDDATFDQAVRFSALQANFPIPPGGSTTDDRIFIVTYIYH